MIHQNYSSEALEASSSERQVSVVDRSGEEVRSYIVTNHMTKIIITTKPPPSSSPTQSSQSLIDDEVEEVLLAQQEEQNGFGEKLSAEARIEVNCLLKSKDKVFYY